MKEDAAFLCLLIRKTKQILSTSLTGSILLLRQTYLDADWYEKGGNLEQKSEFRGF